jgi:hypothetical protein
MCRHNRRGREPPFLFISRHSDMEQQNDMIWEVRPSVKFHGRVPIYVKADSHEKAKARAERAVIERDGDVPERAFERMRESQMNGGLSPRIVEGHTEAVQWGPESDHRSDDVFETCSDELEQKKKRKSPYGFTVIGYDVQTSARVRFTVDAEDPEDAVRKFMKEYADKNYVARSATNVDEHTIGDLEEKLGVAVVSCHEGYSTERVQDVVSYA